ncbi:hypothetical protein [Burkholderia sp. LMG 21824]|uniref:hypothetical protein n=1 Tax=Burkholderia sp. LMG 21824 TaxID=3158172 RepID=UPI003C2E50B0
MNDKLLLNRDVAEDVDPVPSSADWTKLTAASAQPALFATDIYFHECWAEAAEHWLTGTAGVARRLGLLIFKPDAIVGRRVERAVDFTTRDGFRVVSASIVHVNRHVSAEPWHYNWNFATVDRIRMSSLSYDECNTLALVVANADAAADRSPVPASVRLSELNVGRSLQRLVANGAMSSEIAASMREAGGSRSLTRSELTRAIALDNHNPWNFLTVGTTLLCDEREGHVDLLPGTVGPDWIRGDSIGFYSEHTSS